MASDFAVSGTMKNQMAAQLNLQSATLEPAGATWDQSPPQNIPGNSDGNFKASVSGSGSLSGTIVYLPSNAKTLLTFTFTVDGKNNKAAASYPMIGPTVSAEITQGTNANATYAYFR